MEGTMCKIRTAIVAAKEKVENKLAYCAGNMQLAMAGERGEAGVNWLGGVVLAVLVIVIAFAAINKFFPQLFTDIISKASSGLNSSMSGAVASPTIPNG